MPRHVVLRAAIALVLATGAGCGGRNGQPLVTLGPEGSGPPGPVVSSVTFVTPNVGWILRGVGDPNWPAQISTIDRTTDGGKTWHPVPVPASPVRWSRFFDAQTAIVLTEGLFITRDAGGSWTRIDPPSGGPSPPTGDQPAATLVDFSAVDVGWFMYRDPIAGRTSLYTTSDAGSQWVTVLSFSGDSANGLPRPDVEGVGYYGPSSGGITVVDATTAWVAERHGLYVTHDGGSNWQRSSAVPPDGASRQVQFDAPRFDTTSHAWAVAVDYGESSRYHSYVYDTTDGGRTWNGPLRDIRSDARPASYSFLDRAHGWVVADSGTMSVYDGRQWNDVLLVGYGTPCLSLQFLDAVNGWAVITRGGRHLLSTADGGRSWRIIATPTGPS